MPGVPTSVALLSLMTVAAVGGGVAAASSASAAAEQKKEMQSKQEQDAAKQAEMMKKLQGNVPTPGDAQGAAKKEMDRKRRMSALAGGKTILTSEGSPTTSGQKTLLGA